MAKAPEPKKTDKKAVAKPVAKPAPTKAAKNAAAKSPAPVAKAPPKKAPPPGDHTEATGRDHPSQSEHSAQAEKMRALYEKLHGKADQRASIPGQGPPGKKKGGFDASQIRGAGKTFGGGGNQMMRRTQSRGGGSGGGGGGGGSGGSAA